jgi:hypothetical protein
VEEYHGIAVRFCWTRKPALKMAAIAGSDRNVTQSCAEAGDGGFGCLALLDSDPLRVECQFSKKDAEDPAEHGITDHHYAEDAPCSHLYNALNNALTYWYVEWAL